MQQRVERWTAEHSRDVGCSDETPATLVTEVLNDGCAYAGELCQFIVPTTALFRSADENRALINLIDLVTGLDWLVKSLDCVGMALKVDFGATSYGSRSLRQFVEELNLLLAEIMKAQERKDWVLLADLLEYELSPHIEQWSGMFTMLKGRVPSA